MLVGQIQSLTRGSGDNLYAIRRYHSTDHMRNIDWKATAKSMEMMVREHMREDERRLTIVFDTSVPPALVSKIRESFAHAASETGREEKSAEGTDEPGAKTEAELFQDKFERAVVMTASLANHFLMERADVELITMSDEQNVVCGSGPEHLYKILRSLATLQPDLRLDEAEPA